MPYQINNLEIDVALTCNLKCAHCTHNAPHYTESHKSDDLVNNNILALQCLKSIANVKVVRLVGGEPFTSEHLYSYLKILRAINLGERISVFTNGMSFVSGQFDKRIFPLLDDLRVSLYLNSDIINDKILQTLKVIQATFPQLDIQYNRIGYFTKFNLIEETQDPKLVAKIHQNCIYSSGEGVNLYNGMLYRCFASWRKRLFLLQHKQQLTIPQPDVFRLTPTSTEEDLQAFLEQTQPLEACKWCLGCSGKPFKHRQLNGTHPNDVATLGDLDFEAGKSYLSNLLYSWVRNDPEPLNHTKFYDSRLLKDYLKYFSQNTFEFPEKSQQTSTSAPPALDPDLTQTPF